MSCSICGNKYHNARTCPFKSKEVPRDQALWMKIDFLTQREVSDLQAQIIKDKDRIAPNARATAAKGNKSELPARIKEALRLSGGEYDTEEK